MSYVDEVTSDTVVQTCMCDALFLSFTLEREFDQILLPYKEGIYRINGLTPAVAASEQCFIPQKIGRTIGLVEIPYSELAHCNESVYNKHGKMLIHNSEMRRKKELLSLEPTLPVRGFRLLRDYIDYVVHQELRWCKSDYAEQRLYRNNILPNIDISELIIALNCSLRSTRRLVLDFVENSEWNHYRVYIDDNNLVVDKCGDYRICEWYRLTQRKNNSYDEF